MSDPDLDIRPATEADLDALFDLWSDFSREMAEMDPYNEVADGDLRAVQDDYRREALADDDQRIFLAVAADGDGGPVPVGYVTAERKGSPPVFARGDRVNVGELYVRERYRGEGLADRLLDRALAWGRDQGCERISLSVNVDNERARAFYERRGFEPRRLKLDRPLE
ncbi:GNAT family N-acetyltransferase [Haloglomus litoreum]|uniref:GNAT family N-acetyltransferase n=1 Tax=Haloglomus litoreum TaxID=3034026 RepID=UPI0023E7AB4E|nr:GNAT family N-acetyltransferase [Haloglomus sp. DT116]